MSRDGEYYEITRHSKGGDSVIEYKLPVMPGERTYYFDCFDSADNNLNEPYYGAFSVYVDGDLMQKQYPSQGNNGIVKLTVRANEAVRISVTVNKNVRVRSFGVYSVANDLAKAEIADARTAEVSIQGDEVSGIATAESDGEYLFLSLPYDKGYSATVNGQKAEIVRVFDTFMALKLSKGENLIQMHYSPPGFKLGAAISAAGLGILLLCWYFLVRKGRRLHGLEKPASVLLACICIGAVLVMYVMPVVIYIIWS